MFSPRFESTSSVGDLTSSDISHLLRNEGLFERVSKKSKYINSNVVAIGLDFLNIIPLNF